MRHCRTGRAVGVCSFVQVRAGSGLAFCGAMITNDETTDAFTEVLEAAGARVCVSCGRRALVRTGRAASAKPDCAPEDDRVDNVVWFCFACGREQENQECQASVLKP